MSDPRRGQSGSCRFAIIVLCLAMIDKFCGYHVVTPEYCWYYYYSMGQGPAAWTSGTSDVLCM